MFGEPSQQHKWYFVFFQVCVEECPSENEVGVRNNPVCVDSVDTSLYTDIGGDVTLQAVSLLCCLYVVLG